MFILFLLFLCVAQTKGQSKKKQYNQTIRGIVIDHETKQALIGANILILKSNPFKGNAKGSESL